MKIYQKKILFSPTNEIVKANEDLIIDIKANKDVIDASPYIFIQGLNS